MVDPATFTTFVGFLLLMTIAIAALHQIIATRGKSRKPTGQCSSARPKTYVRLSPTTKTMFRR